MMDLGTWLRNGWERWGTSVWNVGRHTRQRPRTYEVTELARLAALGATFATIYADPPWQYENQAARGAAGKEYPTMPLDEIAALPVAPLAAPQAHLHLWVTSSMLAEGLQVMAAWGFTYKTHLVWVKPQMGSGNYWRMAHELLLFGVKGRCPFRDHALRSWVEVSRGPHSNKPEQIRQMIEKTSPPPYLELFGRRLSPGWTVWGNAIERSLFDITVPTLR